MAISTEQSRRQALEKIARNLAADLPEEDRPAYTAAYVGSMLELNDHIDRRLDRLVDELAPLVTSHVPYSPLSVNVVLNHYTNTIRDLMAGYMKLVGGVSDSGTRSLLVVALRDCYRACAKATQELAEQGRLISGELQQ